MLGLQQHAGWLAAQHVVPVASSEAKRRVGLTALELLNRKRTFEAIKAPAHVFADSLYIERVRWRDGAGAGEIPARGDAHDQRALAPPSTAKYWPVM
jgi:hypothetical protein